MEFVCSSDTNLSVNGDTEKRRVTLLMYVHYYILCRVGSNIINVAQKKIGNSTKHVEACLIVEYDHSNY